MTVSRKLYEVALNERAGREWVRPSVKRLAADSAENGGNTSTDVGVSFS